jgi:hypothetical protein
MIYKKIIGLFLFLSFQAHCMLIVNQLPKKKVVKADGASVNQCANRLTSIENYRYNESFFQNKMISDMQPVVMSNLDHKSNIQLIETCKHLYDRYALGQSNGVRHYNNCLFTLQPFDVVDYTKAMFHYAPQDEEKAKLLLRIGGDVQRDRENIMTLCRVDHSDVKAVIGFYKQLLSINNIVSILGNPTLLTRLLKQGLSPNNQDENGVPVLAWAVYAKCIEALKILLADDRANPNIQDKDALTALVVATHLDHVEILNILLLDPRTNPNMQIEYGITPLIYAAKHNKTPAIKALLANDKVDPNAGGIFGSAYHFYSGKDSEITRILSERTSLYNKYSHFIVYAGEVLLFGGLAYGAEKFFSK